MLYRFHVNLFARPADVVAVPDVELRGLHLLMLRATAWDAYFPVTFDQAFDALQKLPRIDAEPDGFFVISGDHAGARWQVDGHLFDFDDRLHRVELHGSCPPQTFDSLLACFGWPSTALIFELVREGVALDEPAFRAWAGA